jgi:hypothetical protein
MSLGHVMSSRVAVLFFREDALDGFGFGASGGTPVQYRERDAEDDADHRHDRPNDV